MSRVKAADVRVYFDADVLGLAHILCRERTDFTYPGDPGLTLHKRRRSACAIAPHAKDQDWIPIVSRRNWLIIGRDRHIQQRPVELDAVRRHNARMVNLAGEDAGNTWAQLEVFMTRWREIEAVLEKPGPFIYQAFLTKSLRSIDLELAPVKRRSASTRAPVSKPRPVRDARQEQLPLAQDKEPG